MVEQIKKQIIGRPLLQEEWKLFRDLRFEALTVDVDKFGAKKEIEETYTEDKWRAWIDSEGYRVFGLFDGSLLIGITSVIPWSSDKIEIECSKSWKRGPFEQSAFFVASYIKTTYRGLGLSRLINEMRLKWSASQVRFCRALTAHRVTNRIAQKTHVAAGFTAIERRPYNWSDGIIDDLIIYERNLSDLRKNNQRMLLAT